MITFTTATVLELRRRKRVPARADNGFAIVIASLIVPVLAVVALAVTALPT